MSDIYAFTPELAFDAIEEHWTSWDNEVNPDCYVVGISGGIDSSCVAALACKLFGKERVIGVSLPCNGQSDMTDVDKVFNHLGIKRATIDIGDIFDEFKQNLENQTIELTDVCKTNMPARIRMTMLYGIAQCMNGIVLNTCNLSEDVVGYSTFGGDNMGSYAPIKNLTKTEVKSLAKWLDIPNSLIYKTPIDGLQPLSDEEKLGFTYERLDKLIRCQDTSNIAFNEKIHKLFVKNKFKTDIINIPGPEFKELSNYARAFWNMKS